VNKPRRRSKENSLKSLREKLKQLEAKFREAEAKYRALVEHIPAVTYVSVFDKSSSTLYISPKIETMLGFSQEEWMEDPEIWFKQLHPEDHERVLAELARSHDNGGPFISEYRLFARDGRVLWVHDEAAVIKDESGRFRFLHGVMLDITERKRAEEAIIHQAYHDSLTDLPNRVLFKDRLTLALAHARRNKRLLAVMFLDLDRFKNINDTLGHERGDQFLKNIAERLKNLFREGDTIARLGGDEFALILPEINQMHDAVKIAQRIMETIKQPWSLANHEFHTTISIGIAVYPNDGEDVETLLKNSDIAMYRAKERGRDNYQFYNSTMSDKILEKLELENSLRQALEHQEFVLYYQPRVNINLGQIVCMEALIRWQKPDQGLIAPDKFIPLAEESGLILPIGEWVLKTACAQNKAWQEAGFSNMCVAVNLSSRQFQQQNLVKMIAQVLKETGLEARWLELEITEAAAMQDVDYTIKTLRSLGEMGVHIFIDDFGIGYSSLNYLKRLPINALKIDKSFVKDITTDANDAAIVSTIINLGQNLKLKVIAEGVETEKQLLFLKEQGCDEIQGYLISKPMPAANFDFERVGEGLGKRFGKEIMH
jgi:diguanylate cyclase (GGDEF)-like protein/PAS domain S-box-containing protein